jgi:hypothetical protein
MFDPLLALFNPTNGCCSARPLLILPFCYCCLLFRTVVDTTVCCYCCSLFRSVVVVVAVVQPVVVRQVVVVVIPIGLLVGLLVGVVLLDRWLLSIFGLLLLVRCCCWFVAVVGSVRFCCGCCLFCCRFD